MPPATTVRTDLLYGYYCSGENQVAETKDHVNLFMECSFEGTEKTITSILEAKLPTVLSVSYLLFNENGVGHALAETYVRDHFNLFKARGALQYVKYLYPIDEPNNVTTLAELTKAMTILKKIAAEFPELNGVRYATIYAGSKGDYIGIEMFDLVGVDAYDDRSGFLTGEYVRLLAALRPDQRTILVPGGFHGENPTPWVNFAETHPEVEILMPFLWQSAALGVGIRTLEIKQAYIDAGKYITGK